MISLAPGVPSSDPADDGVCGGPRTGLPVPAGQGTHPASVGQISPL